MFYDVVVLYVVRSGLKNSDIEEIVLRLESLIRRQYNIHINTLALGKGYAYNIIKKELLFQNNQIEVPPITKRLFECLLQFRTNYVSSEYIEKYVYPPSSRSKNNVIRYHIYEIRKILGDKFIQSKKNLGYKLDLKEILNYVEN